MNDQSSKNRPASEADLKKMQRLERQAEKAKAWLVKNRKEKNLRSEAEEQSKSLSEAESVINNI